MASLFLYKLSNGKTSPPWEGMTWILDLLPHNPKQALEGLAAYTIANIQFLPDGRISGLWDAEEIIRAKYIGNPQNQSDKIELLNSMPSRDFELLVERLYSKMGYSTKITPQTRDGGKDIIATKTELGKSEEIRIECKLYNHPVGIGIIRALLGVVSDEKVNKGVLITSHRFTKGAIDLAKNNPRIELISGTELIILFHKYLGQKWPLHINKLLFESQKKIKPNI